MKKLQNKLENIYTEVIVHLMICRDEFGVMYGPVGILLLLFNLIKGTKYDIAPEYLIPIGCLILVIMYLIGKGIRKTKIINKRLAKMNGMNEMLTEIHAAVKK